MFVGIDGCRGGWFAVRTVRLGAPVHATMYPTFERALADLADAKVIGVDMPIGLAERGERACDVEARAFLAPHRNASIFSAPLRSVLGAQSHDEASSRRFKVEGKRMSIQAYWILHKVQEVDHALARSPAHSARVFEVHPEVSFAEMNQRAPLLTSKKRSDGRAERLALLRHHFGEVPAHELAVRSKTQVAADDVLDAFAVLWSALRIGAGVARSFPPVAPVDATGLRMSISV